METNTTTASNVPTVKTNAAAPPSKDAKSQALTEKGKKKKGIDKKYLQGAVIGLLAAYLICFFYRRYQTKKKGDGNNLAATQERGTLRMGDNNQYVTRLTLALNQLGLKIPVDSRFDSHLDELVQELFKNTAFLNEKGELKLGWLEGFLKPIEASSGVSYPTPEYQHALVESIIQKGDKDSMVQELSGIIARIQEREPLTTDGNYSKALATETAQLWQGTSILTDTETGAVDAEFISEMAKVISQL